MKTFLKIFITLVVVAGAFTAYLVFQPPRAMQQSATRPAVPPVQRNASGSIIGEGQNAWVRQFDDEGRLASRFRAEKWEPQKNGLVRVIRPEAELLLKGGKDKDGKDKPRPLVRIRGDDGEVVVQSLPDAAATDKPLASSQAGSPNTPTGKGASVGPAQPPSSGRLNGVVIDVFETEDAKEPRVTLRTNNIVFDNDTFRISTESYPADDGSTVPPDQVKVSVTGPDFEFYGRGLTVRWNDLDERLDLLRIAHGDHLVIKNIEAFSSGDLPLGVPAPATAAPTASTRAPALDLLASADPGAALALASADRRRKGAVAAPASRPVRRKPKSAGGKDDQPVYRAAFHEDVRVVQGEQPLATARLMNIDFLAGERKSDTPATKPASTRKADANDESAAPAATEPAATRDVATSQPLESAATSQPTATAPSTAPSAQPVTVYWTGESTVTPSPIPAATSPATAPTTLPSTVAPADQPLPPGEARVELVGAPAVLTHAPLDIRTGRFVWRTDGRLALDAAADVPRVLITQKPADGQGPDTTVSTEGLTYSRGERVAVLRGDSRVLAPVGGEAGATAETGAAPAMIDAAWRETAEFKLVGEREDEMWVEHAAFAGKVNVTAPQGLVRSERLELTFDPPTPKPAATTRPATHPATQTAQQPDTRLATRAAGDSSPNLRRIVATDGVYCELIDAAKGKQLVECQRLALDTARSETGELYPRVVDASGVVRASTAEQSLDAGHVVLQLRPARTAPATQPAQAEDGAGAGAIAATQPAPFNGTVPFTGKGQWALADATSVGVARTMRPKTDPAAAFELESMTATDSVRVASLDGGVATGKRLVVTVGDDGTPRVELTGDPARVEHANASGTLTGPRIEVDPKTGVARVVGPGTMRAVQREERKDAAGVFADAAAGGTLTLDAPARPIEVTWSDGADVRGGEDRIDITGAVSLWITDVDGSVRTATAGRVSVELAKKAPETPAGNGKADAPANPPADAPGDSAADAPERAKKAKPAGGVQFAQSMNMDLFEGKEVSKVHLYDNAVINSKLVGDDGSVLRQFHLKAQTITYDARSRHLTVPGPGQMLVEAHDGPAGDEPKQAAGKGRDDVAAFTSGNGVTAFQWAQKLEYDEAAGRAVMDGSVVVSHQPDRKGDAPVRIDSDTLTATFETQRGAASQPEKAVAKGASDGTSVGDAGATKLQMRSMTARGNILISREGSELTAHEISYDPATEWVVARGTPRNPASFSASAGAGTMRAGELWLNTRTWQVKVKDVNTRLGVGEIKR